MNIVDQKLYGWKFSDEDGMLVPIWFTGSQLAPSLQRNRRRGKKRSVEHSSSKNEPLARKRFAGDSDAEFADGELSDIPKELPLIEYAVPAQLIVCESVTENDGDDEHGNEVESESSDWEVSDDFELSNDSGSDYEWGA